MNELASIYEQVFTIADYYDGPRKGVANFQGKPHYYDCVLAERGASDDGYTDNFYLSPIAASALDLVIEDWTIWQQWERPFHEGRVTEESHPALPAEQKRHQELKSALDLLLQTDFGKAIVRKGEFRVAPGEMSPPGIICELEVRWTELAS